MFTRILRRRKLSTRRYLRKARVAKRRGLVLPDPATFEELDEAYESYPDQRYRFRPSPLDCARMGRPDLIRRRRAS